MDLRGKKITLHDMCLRDGMHPKRHQISLEQMVAVATALDAAGVPLIEVTHGDGLGGASVNYGFPAHTDEEYLRAVVPEAEAREGLRAAAARHRHRRSSAHGARLRRRHDPRRHALHRGGRLRAAHRALAQARARHGRLPDDGAHDRAGRARRAGEAHGELRRELHLLHRLGRLHAAGRRDGAHRRAARRRSSPRPRSASTAITTWRWASRTRWPRSRPAPVRIDGSAAGLGAGAGNTPLEVFNAVCDRMGIVTGVDVFKLMDVAEDLVVPMMDHPIRIDRDALILGYAGVYSSFLLFAKRASAQVRRAVARHPGRARPPRTVGGQEDMIEDLALNLSRARKAG